MEYTPAVIDEMVRYMANENPGLAGEFMAYMVLSELPGPRRFLHNLLVTAAWGEIHDTEVDLVMINPAGIHVIEVKNFSGWIFGNIYDKYWTQTLIGKQGSCHKHQFFNPLRQNYGHVQALKQNLSFIFDGLSFYPVVAFSDHCEFRTKLSTTNEPVVYVRELAKTVAEIDLEHNACLDRDEIELIYQFWKLLENLSPGHKKAHATYVRSLYTFNQNTA